MTSPASECREDRLTGQLPAPARYPLSARRYLLAALGTARPQPSDSSMPRDFARARARRMKRSARALVWWLPFWYVLAQAVLLATMDDSWPLNHVRVEHAKWKQLHKRLAEAPDRPLVLSLGSSRIDWAFQAGRLDGQPGPDGRPLLVYNFGVPAAGPMHEFLYVNDFLAEGIRPRLLLVEFVGTHFNQSRRGIASEEHWTEPRWISGHQLLFLHRYFRNPRRAIAEWLEGRLAPWYCYRWTIHERLLGNHLRPDPLDQTRRPMDSCGSRMLADDIGTPGYRAWRYYEANKMYGESLQRFQMGAKPVQAMHDLLDRCQREHIAVALVVMPVSKEFSSLYNPQGRADLDSLLAQLRRHYGIEVIDASDWLEQKDFDDGHHVLKTGARKFTTRMIDEVQKLLARTDPPQQVKTCQSP